MITMRISTAQFFRNYSRNISNSQEKLTNLQNEISSGKKSNLNSLEKYKQHSFSEIINKQNQYQDNNSYAKNKLESEENIMGAINILLDDTKDLIIRNNSSISNSSDREIFLEQIKQNEEQLLDLANFKDHEEYIFSGYNSLDKTYDENKIFKGTIQNRSIPISENNYIQIGDSGSEIFDDIFKTLDILKTSISNNTSLDQSLSNIDNNIENNQEIIAKIGTKQTTLDFVKNNNQKFLDTQEKLLSEVEDIDYSETILQMNAESFTLQAIQKSYLQVQSLSLFNYI